MKINEGSAGPFDVAVVGAGPAGIMAAIRAGQMKRKTVLIERNDSIGRKLLLTGRHRCNVTNAAPIDSFIEKFGRRGEFLRSAFFAFSNQDLMNFFEDSGVELKIERQGRVFASSDNAAEIVGALKRRLAENGVSILYNSRLAEISKEGKVFVLGLKDGKKITAKKAVVATGGASYAETGSTGDGFRIAEGLGHTVVPLRPGLVPLKTKERWVKDVKGLTLKNIRITFECGGKRLVSNIGEILFTHFGVSGPLILDLSGRAVDFLSAGRQVALSIDFKPALSVERLEERLLRDIEVCGKKGVKNFLKGLLPSSLMPVFIKLWGVASETKASQITRAQRRYLVSLLKGLKLTVTGSLPLEEAMVTCGGISTKQIDPRTMESRVVSGLYFAGEIIDATAASGGYNLQQAFSTGYLAGEKAAECAR